MTDTDRPARSPGQQLALAQLRRIASVGDVIRVVAVHEPTETHRLLGVDVSIRCAGLRYSPSGLRMHQRELVVVLVPADFPLALPQICTRHRRFAGAPHVQWNNVICLYRSPSLEWDPADGMYGFIERLIAWFEQAAIGQLDAPGQPLHPPVAYGSARAGLLVIRADTPYRSVEHRWLGVALVRSVNDRRSDILGWLGLGDRWPTTPQEARAAAGVAGDGDTVFLAAAVLATEPIAFEYPDTASALLDALADDAVSADLLLGLLGFTARHNTRLATTEIDGTTGIGETGYDEDGERDGAPLYLVVGDPSRGTAESDDHRTHLAAWRLPEIGRLIAELVPAVYSDNAEIAEAGRRVAKIGKQWLDVARTEWAVIDEARPEIVVRRDADSPAQWVHGKRVLVLGAGAIGAPIAEHCVRGGAARVVVVDRGSVRQGVLVRQPYTDGDIGEPKAKALVRELRRIRPDAQVDAVVRDVRSSGLPGEKPPFDLIIDATADRIVRTHLELNRAAHRNRWPALATLLVGHDATRGLAAISASGASGGGVDVLRRAGLAARAEPSELGDFAEDFFTTRARTGLFQPEPGCSDATFVGGAAAVAALTGELFTGVLATMSDPDIQNTMATLFIRLPGGPQDRRASGHRWVSWPDDVVLDEPTGLEVRISARAGAEMRAEARRGARIREPRVETGGILLGAIDDAAGVVWVDEVTGPPPDSLLSQVHFDHGTSGVEQHLAARRKATGLITRFLGMWHTHPYGPVRPSATDEAGMAALVAPPGAPPRALILIAGGPPHTWIEWLRGRGLPHWYTRVVDRAEHPDGGCAQRRRHDVEAHYGPMTWWPGGFATRVDAQTSDRTPRSLTSRVRSLPRLVLRWCLSRSGQERVS